MFDCSLCSHHAPVTHWPSLLLGITPKIHYWFHTASHSLSRALAKHRSLPIFVGQSSFSTHSIVPDIFSFGHLEHSPWPASVLFPVNQDYTCCDWVTLGRQAEWLEETLHTLQKGVSDSTSDQTTSGFVSAPDGGQTLEQQDSPV